MVLRAISVAAACVLLAGCATDGTSLPSFGCSVFKPIEWSRKDTRDTIRQVQAHNAVGVKTCGWTK